MLFPLSNYRRNKRHTDSQSTRETLSGDCCHVQSNQTEQCRRDCINVFASDWCLLLYPFESISKRQIKMTCSQFYQCCLHCIAMLFTMLNYFVLNEIIIMNLQFCNGSKYRYQSDVSTYCIIRWRKALLTTTCLYIHFPSPNHMVVLWLTIPLPTGMTLPASQLAASTKYGNFLTVSHSL